MYKNTTLTDNDFIDMAMIVDNNFIGNNHIKISNKSNLVRVYGYTKGGQCCNCDVKFILKDNFIESILTQNEDTETEGAYRSITNETFNKMRILWGNKWGKKLN